VDSETLYLLAKSQAGAVILIDYPGPPSSGTWFTGNLVLDSLDVLWVCVAGGTPGTWVEATSQWLNPTSQSTDYTALNGDNVEATASLTVTSPAASKGNRFGAIASYAATNAEPVTLTAVSGSFVGPGIPADTTSIILGAEGAYVQCVYDGDGHWLVTAGAQDTGWIALGLINSWEAESGLTPAARLTGNVARLQGGVYGGDTATQIANPVAAVPGPSLSCLVTGAAQQTSDYPMPIIYFLGDDTGVTIEPFWDISLTMVAVYLNGITYTVD
jgi:hypothetical protein